MANQLESEAQHAERMRLLNAAIVRLHGFSLSQLREANVLLATVRMPRPSESDRDAAESDRDVA